LWESNPKIEKNGS